MMGCDGPAPGHPDTGELPINLGGRPMDRCPMKLLSDSWTQEIVKIHKARAGGHLTVRCPSPCAKTLAALDMLDANEAEHRQAEKVTGVNPGRPSEGVA